MKAKNVQFREEEDVAGFLGVHVVDRKDDGFIHLTQKGLAKRIVSAMHLNHSSVTPVEVPAKGYLPIDENGEIPHMRHLTTDWSSDNYTIHPDIPGVT